MVERKQKQCCEMSRLASPGNISLRNADLELGWLEGAEEEVIWL